MKKIILPLLFTLFYFSATIAQELSLSKADRNRIAEVFRLAEQAQNNIWNEWSKAPFAILLVTPEHEFLIRHPNPSEDFTSIGYDSLLQSTVYVREAVYPPNFLASFPAVGRIPTIVIGQPKNTGKSSTFWVLTALHEHFHQLQYSQPNYYPSVNALGLSGRDQSGMWMLNYPFPYDSTEVIKRFTNWKTALLKALQSGGTTSFDNKLSAYLDARAALRKVLPKDDYKYFSFQLWQEGIARYTEYKVAKTAAAHYTPTERFQSLKDFVPFEQATDTLYKNIIQGLQEASLAEWERVAFYPTGAAVGLLLDIVKPNWKKYYFEKRFDLSNLFGK